MTAISNTETGQPQQDEPSLANSTTQVSTRPRSSRSSQASLPVWPDDFPPLEEPVDGWPTIAKMMTLKPEFANFSRFSDLHKKSLLYYHAELIQLRKELHELECNDKRTREQDGDGPSSFYWRADFLVASRDGIDHKQWDMIVKIRQVLKEYSAALLQHIELSKVPSPDPCNVESFRRWLAAPSNPQGIEPRVGGNDEQHIWGNIYHNNEAKAISLHQKFFHLLWHLIAPKSERKRQLQQHLDLVAASPRKEVDFLTTWVMGEFIPFYTLVKETSFFVLLRTLRLDIKKIISSQLRSDDMGEKDAEKAIGKVPKVGKIKQTPNNDEAVTIETYSGNNMLRFTLGIATIIACLLPTVAITVLSKINDTGSRLGAIAGFTALFAAGLMGLTNSGTSRVEIFTATAAFSAVMVVFVQNGTPPQKC